MMGVEVEVKEKMNSRRPKVASPGPKDASCASG